MAFTRSRNRTVSIIEYERRQEMINLRLGRDDSRPTMKVTL